MVSQCEEFYHVIVVHVSEQCVSKICKKMVKKLLQLKIELKRGKTLETFILIQDVGIRPRNTLTSAGCMCPLPTELPQLGTTSVNPLIR